MWVSRPLLPAPTGWPRSVRQRRFPAPNAFAPDRKVGKHLATRQDLLLRTPDSRPPAGSRSEMRLLARSEEHTSELQSLRHIVCRLLLEKKKTQLRGAHFTMELAAQIGGTVATETQ